MALIFPRLARNFIKNGYYPTDQVTLGRVLNGLHCAGTGARLLDPCCGEGAALSEIKTHLAKAVANATGSTESLTSHGVAAFGVEFDSERAWHAKELLDRVIHADANDVVISPRSMGLLYLNPPYGFGVADRAGNGSGNSGPTERLERAFLKLSTPWLAYGGVLVLIVPHYAVDVDMANYLARNYKDVRMFMAPEQEFKQCVIFGVRDKAKTPSPRLLQAFEHLQTGALVGQAEHQLPEQWAGQVYSVPEIQTDPEHRFQAVRIEPRQFAAELKRFAHATLWPSFKTHFAQTRTWARRPLRDMSQWHLALALAAGQMQGIVTSPAGRTLLIKGNTFKKKARSVTQEVDEQGGVSHTTTMLDVFEPVIRAIDFTVGPSLGTVVTIR